MLPKKNDERITHLTYNLYTDKQIVGLNNNVKDLQNGFDIDKISTKDPGLCYRISSKINRHLFFFKIKFSGLLLNRLIFEVFFEKRKITFLKIFKQKLSVL